MVNVAEDQKYPDGALGRGAVPPRCRRQTARRRKRLSGAITGLVRSCARPLFLAGGDSEDLIQEGMFGPHPGHSRVRSAQRPRPSGPLPRCASATASFPRFSAASRDKHSPLNQSVPLDTPFFDGNSYPYRRSAQPPPADPEELIIDRETRGRERLRALESSCPSSRRRS